MRYEEFLAAGVRIVAIDVDSPGQHSAMVSKLGLPFPYLSDPDRSRAIGPYGLSNPDDPRGLAIPAMVLVDTDGEERFRFRSRDYAERLPEDEVLAEAGRLGLAPVEAEPLRIGPEEPGPRAMPLRSLGSYLRGAKFAALAMGRRYEHLDPAIGQDADAYAASMDRMIAAVKDLRASREDG